MARVPREYTPLGDYIYGAKFQGIFENENIEFKKCGTGNLGTLVNDCLRYCVGFLNARIKGNIFFGVCDDKTIEGVPLDPFVDASGCLDTLHKKFESECLTRLNTAPVETFYNFDVHYVRNVPQSQPQTRVIIVFSITKIIKSPLYIWAILDRDKETGQYALLKKKGILKMMSPTDIAILVTKYVKEDMHIREEESRIRMEVKESGVPVDQTFRVMPVAQPVATTVAPIAPIAASSANKYYNPQYAECSVFTPSASVMSQPGVDHQTTDNVHSSLLASAAPVSTLSPMLPEPSQLLTSSEPPTLLESSIAPASPKPSKAPHPKMTKENVIRTLRQNPEGLEVREIALLILGKNPMRDKAESADIQTVKRIVYNTEGIRCDESGRKPKFSLNLL